MNLYTFEETGGGQEQPTLQGEHEVAQLRVGDGGSADHTVHVLACLPTGDVPRRR